MLCAVFAANAVQRNQDFQKNPIYQSQDTCKVSIKYINLTNRQSNLCIAFNGKAFSDFSAPFSMQKGTKIKVFNSGKEVCTVIINSNCNLEIEAAEKIFGLFFNVKVI
jgi:hypothetical protein